MKGAPKAGKRSMAKSSMSTTEGNIPMPNKLSKNKSASAASRKTHRLNPQDYGTDIAGNKTLL